MESAHTLTSRLEKLSSVALRSGAAAPAIARLLESASVATLHAVALDLLCGEAMPEALPRRLEERPAAARLLDAA